jgi:NTE family protein
VYRESEKTAFVLSGGASLGAIQAGMLRAVYERGIRPDLIVGTSVGAVNAAFVASRPQTPRTARDLAEIWRAIGRGDVFPLNPVTGFLGFFGARDHLVPDSGLRGLLEDHLEFERLQEAPIELHVIATDVLSGAEERLSRGNARDAVMASAAIPGVFPPVVWHDRELVDGGVANNAPISHALEMGATKIYVLPTGTACDLDEPPRGALGMLLHSMNLLVMRRLLVEIELLRDRAELIVLPPPCPLRVSSMDFGHADELIRDGHESAAGHLDAVASGCAVAAAPAEVLA